MQPTRVEAPSTAEWVGSLPLRRALVNEHRMEYHWQERMLKELPAERQNEARERLKRLRDEWQAEDRMSRI